MLPLSLKFNSTQAEKHIFCELNLEYYTLESADNTIVVCSESLSQRWTQKHSGIIEISCLILVKFNFLVKLI